MNTLSASFIETPGKENYTELVEIWEASVRATHHFLREEDIQYFKPLILDEFLDAVQLNCIKVEKRIAGFLGTAANKIEMLFVHPDFHGKGIGKKLLLYAIDQLNKTQVDVNEQNEQAVGFYLHFGFVIISRSEKDGMGKPYPILHMQLTK